MTIEEWLGTDNALGIDIWHRKYQYENETFEEWLDRISNGNQDIRQLILEKKFLFGGRILSNRGLSKKGRKVTYSNCFTGDALVVTSCGLKRIDQINVGDKVLSHDGEFHNVNHVMSRNYYGDMYKFSGTYIGNTQCTPNHQILTSAGWRRIDDIDVMSNEIPGIRNAAIVDVLKKIKNKTIAYFGTAGYKESKMYYRKLFERVKSNIDSSNKILGYFYCQGKMPMQVKEKYE